MNAIIGNLDVFIEQFLSNLGIWGAIISCFFITVESMLPILPLCVFITLVFYSFGPIIGFIICWIFTIIGCILAFTLFRTKIRKWFLKKLKPTTRKKIDRLLVKVEKMKLSSLAILVAIPFTPAFFVNIACALSNMEKKKFIIAIMIGKIFMIYFWGYIGTTLIECLTHPIYLVKILVLLLIAFVLSKIISKKFNID